MSKQLEIELIEQYIDNQLNAADRAAFEARMTADADFRAGVELQRRIQAELADVAQLKLLGSLQEIVQKPFEEHKSRSGKAVWWMFGVVAVLVAGYFGYLNLFAPLVTPALPPAPAPQSTPQPEEKIVRPTEPIAALNRADFQVNRTLEPLVGTQVRGGGAIDIKFTRPAAPLTVKAQNGKVNVRVEGIVTADNALDNNALQLLLFSNREADFRNNKPLRKLRVVLNHEKDEYRFRQNIQQNLKPGLYYLVAAEKETNEPLAVTKITVNPN